MLAQTKWKADLSAQRTAAPLWVPVVLGLGIGLYFGLLREPQVWELVLATGSIAVLLVCAVVRQSAVVFLISVFILGTVWSAINARLHEAPRLTENHYGAVTGRVIWIDTSSSGATRLTLDQVRLSASFRDPPERARVSLHGAQEWIVPRPYQTIGLTAHLSPPNGRAEPDGFDFQRHAYFLKLGAVGYTRLPALELAPPEGVSLFGLRHAIGQYVQAHLPAKEAALAMAVTTGDRSGLSQDTLEALRASNLAHLLAISGLHLGLLAGVVFGALRFGFALRPSMEMRWTAKKIAAASALAAASAYLAISGAGIATQRAFIMTAVALCAILLDQRALSLRAVAVAATIVLILHPVSLVSPGFQMSFAATTALIAVFAFLRGRLPHTMPTWAKAALSLLISSSVAGLATAPFGAAHFNQIASYGLLANLLSVPVMGLIVVPAAVAAAVLWPFGLAWMGLKIMGLGLSWILWVAQTISALPNATRAILAPDPQVLPLLTLGAIWLILWIGRFRWLGLLPICCAFALWAQTERPDILIEQQGKLVGIMGPEGRILSKPRGQGFVAQTWLENDGDTATQEEAHHRSAQQKLFQSPIPTGTLWHAPGKRALALFDGCTKGDIFVTDQPLTTPQNCTTFDANTFRQTGSIAIRFDGTTMHITTAQQKRGARLWTPQPVDQNLDQ